MKTPAKSVIYVLIAAGIFFAGYLANRQDDPATSSASAEQSVKFTCPMHPQYTSDRSGTCPVCGMSLVPASSVEIAGNSASPQPDLSGTVRFGAEKQQLAGIRTDEVRMAPVSDFVRVPGRIAVDESRLYRIIAAIDGWIQDIGNTPAGAAVKRNQTLASYYTTNLVITQQNLLFGLNRTEMQQKGEAGVVPQRQPASPSVQNSIDLLRGLGMDDIQIEEIQRSRKHATEVLIHSPIDGFIVARNVSAKQRFEKGSELFTIADVSHVWVLTDIFEKDREFLSPGAMAKVKYRGREFHARMSNSLPLFDPQSRILKTRFELDNPGNILLPDMFVDVELEVNKPSAITVPADAVVDSGRRKTVYVERSAGVFEPRSVETGWRLGARVQITRGLETGERIVTSGNFLIDSETRMKLTSYDSGTPMAEKKKVKDLVCGMEIDPDSANTLKVEREGKTYYFCSSACKTKFLADPAKYAGKKPAEKPKIAKDPVCGMEVDPKSPDTLKTEYQGNTYYFCNESCRKSFEADPEKYLGKGMAPDHQQRMRM